MLNRKNVAEQGDTDIERALERGHKPQKVENLWYKVVNDQ